MAHDVSLTYSRFEHMPPAALALTALLHVGVGLALYWISPLRHVDPFEDAIEVSMEAPAPLPPIPEAKPEAPPVAPPVAPPAAPPAPPPAASAPPPAPPPPQAKPTPTPTPAPAAPPMRLGLAPPPAERSTDPRDIAGAENPAKQATDTPTPDKIVQEGPKEEARKEEPPQEAREEPQLEPKPEPKPEPPPQQQALARPEPAPPPPPPPPALEQALPPLEAPPPPVTERDVPEHLTVPRPAPPPPQQAVRPPPAPPPPAPRPAPQPPAHAQQPPRPSPLTAPPQRGAESQSAARQSAPTFQNPADNYGQKRAKEQYAWLVERRLAQFPYVPKESGPIRQAGSLLLRLTVSREGRLIDVFLERSSGLASLDAGVIETLRRASPYPPVPADIPGDRYTFQLPVNFNYNQNR